MSKVDRELYRAKYGKDDVEYFKHLPEVESVKTMHDEIQVKFKPSVQKPILPGYALDKGNAWMLLAPHYDEVKALEMIRQGVDPTTACKQCLVETVGPELTEVPFRR